MKKSFSIIDLVISILFALFLSFYFIPTGVAFLIQKRDIVPNHVKQEILVAGKKYLQKNSNSYNVSVKELVSTGYLAKDNIDYEQCFDSISLVTKNKNSYDLELQCINDNSKLTLLE